MAHGSWGAKLIASMKCAAVQTILEAKCGFAVAGLIFLPLKAFKFVAAPTSAAVLSQVPAKARPLAKLAFDIYHASILKTAPAGFRSAEEIFKKLQIARRASDVVKLLPDVARAVSRSDFSQISLDIDDIAGLRPCVQALANAMS